MKCFKSLGLCLVAVLAVGAVAAGSASANTQTILFPEGGAKPDFSSITGKGVLHAKGGLAINCESARNSGEARPGTDILRNIRILFSGCGATIQEKVLSCNSTGQPSGSIQTFPLLAELGSLTVGTELVGAYVLTAETGISGNSNNLFAEFKCATTTVKVRGKERGTSGEKGGIIGELASKETKFAKKTAVPIAYKQVTGKPEEQLRQSLTVLGTLVDELLLEASSGSGFELAGLEEEKPVELFFLEEVEFSGI